MHILYSGILDTGSRAGLVRRFTGLSVKWDGMNATPGGDTSVNFALAVISPRREVTLTLSLLLMFNPEASSGFISIISAVSRAFNPVIFRVMVPHLTA